jgi:D-threo-aldose 1-dehydrogenase
MLLGTSLSTTRLGVGTHALHRILSTKSRQRLLAYAYDRGVRHFDTAPSYGAGLAELELGRFTEGRRSELVLTTKFGIKSGRIAAAVPGWLYAQMVLRLAARAAGINRSTKNLPQRDFTPAHIRGSVEESLRRLRTDHIDVLFLHEPQLELLGVGDALERALEDLKVSGKVRYIGLSGHALECARIVAQRPGLAAVVQSEVLAGAQSPAGGPRVAIHFCEFGAPPGKSALDAGFLQTLRALRDAGSESVLLLSTNSIDGLRQAVDSI